jgi:catechol 2,3-dioxygenase-like lactoylglutathione lyase family enzyme
MTAGATEGATTMSVHAMNHFTVLTDDVERTVAFYGEHLGLSPGYRPDLGFPGAWLYADGAAILHIVGGRKHDELKPGVIDHMAFSARGLKAKVAQLEAAGVKYACRKQVGSGVWQVFFFDPNGARVELDFDAAEPAP